MKGSKGRSRHIEGTVQRKRLPIGHFVVVLFQIDGRRHDDGHVAGLILLAVTPRMMEDKASGWKGMSQMRLEALKRGLEITHGQGLFGIPEGLPNPYMMDAPENLENGLRYLQATDLRAELERTFAEGCNFPVYIFHSEYDGIVRSANAAYLKNVFKDAFVQIIPGSDHALPVRVPEAIDRTIETFML